MIPIQEGCIYRELTVAGKRCASEPLCTLAKVSAFNFQNTEVFLLVFSSQMLYDLIFSFLLPYAITISRSPGYIMILKNYFVILKVVPKENIWSKF